MLSTVCSHGVSKEELYEGACNKIFTENGTLEQAFMSLSVIITLRMETSRRTASCFKVSRALCIVFAYFEVLLS